MTQIIKKESFEVNGINFPTEDAAQDYIRQKDNKEAVLKYNSDLLENHGAEYIPVFDPEEQSVDIFIKAETDSGDWRWWKSLIKDREIRYYDEKLVILSPDDFMAKFKEYPSIYIGTNEWNDFLCGVIYLNEKAENCLDWKEVIGLIAYMQVTPQYIYSD